MSLKLQTAASIAAVSLAEAKLHLRVDTTADDTLITSLISAATLDAEHLMSRAILPQKWLLSLDTFYSSIPLPRPIVSAIDYVKYVDATTGALTTLAADVYYPVFGSDYSAQLVLGYGKSWPSVRAQPEAVQILFSCGWQDAASVPESIKAWIKLRVGALYANREAVSDKQTFSLGLADSLLDRYRIWSF